MKQVVSWAAGVLAAVLAGVLVYWLTEGLRDPPGPVGATAQPTDGATIITEPPTEPPTGPPDPLSFVERVRGEWRLESWTEAGGPTTLYIDVSNGTLTITDAGQADWRLDIDERGEDNRPQPAIKCGGQTTLAGGIEGVPGGPRNSSIDWTSDLRSIDHSTTGEGWIWRALCGWATIGTRAPYQVSLDGPETAPAPRMEMANQYGTFRWTR
jgi:hypothetical protein